ncbi:phosphomannomutase [Sinorhizobium fredii]|uniref:Phosphomannomutase NoeK n=1 Tax=Sinorhizobium fredii (strain USDA 257) TaxID=1185652 RepID=I3X6E0_SINF2|nr:phosphomannomutase [Sinorhizobium fredii]AFL51446.1 phosphomannomutase NoeK [Sinorhizobium fredii USDA 257]
MKFGTSGLRGLSVDLLAAGAAIYADAFGRYLIESGRSQVGDPILIGRDFRDSSPAIVAICARALSDLGFRLCDCGTLPTPALALYGMKSGAACLMVTGSHIPADRNGIKFYTPDGEIDKEDEAAITQLAADWRPVDVRIDTPPVVDDHSERCIDLFYRRSTGLLAADALAGVKIGVYQHSTVARDLIGEVLSHYGAEVVPLGRSITFIPVDTEAIASQTISLLGDWTSFHDLDAIVSADGDGDRPLVADERGVPLRGDLLGLMAAEFLRADAIVTPVTSNSGIEALGLPVTRTRVGSPFVIAGMKKAIASGKERVVGFEANGGLLMASACSLNGHAIDALPTRDCMLPILVAVSRIAALKRPLSAITRTYNLPVAASDRLENFPTEKSAELLDYLRASESNLTSFLQRMGDVSSRDEIDGLRVALTDRRVIHFRPSGNAPEIRCYVEAATETAAAELLEAGLDQLRLWGKTDNERSDSLQRGF